VVCSGFLSKPVLSLLPELFVQARAARQPYVATAFLRGLDNQSVVLLRNANGGDYRDIVQQDKWPWELPGRPNIDLGFV
jgi:hypothetical protein